MKKVFLVVTFILAALLITAQNIYMTGVLQSNIKTLQIYPDGDPLSHPVIELNSPSTFLVQFDEMSHNIRNYSYQILHCNEDWTQSALSSNEYLNGFPTADITDYNLSLNTTVLYTNYSFTVPNDYMTFTKSGNYVIQIYEDGQQDKPIAQACFSIVEPKVNISANVRGNTDTELNKRLQQIDFDINLDGYTVRNPQEEIKVVVRQNNRADNQVRGIKPTYVKSNGLSYANNRELIFEGGNEYHRFDISSVYAASQQIERILYNRTQYDAYLYEDKINTSRVYMTDQDVHGNFIVNHQESFYDSSYEADYINIHFSIAREEPFFDGQIYIGGAYNYNLLNEASRMQYDFNSGKYFKTLSLKQGGYNYQYWFLQKGQQKANVERIEGSFWQTKNQYTIYVYQREWGGRYDRLIGFKIVE